MLALFMSITALLASTAVLMVGSGLLGTLLSVRMTAEGYDAGVTGLVMAAYFLGLMLGALGAGGAIRRAGHIRAFAAFAAVVTASTLLHALWVNPLFWGLLRIVCGFSFAGLYMVIESWLNERGQGAARGRLFSLYQIASYLGLGCGQFLLPLRPVETAEMFVINAIFLALCLVPVAMTRSLHPTPPARNRMALRAVLTGSPLGVLICIGAGIVNGAAFALAPVFVIAHAGVQSVSVFMGAMVLGGMLLQYPIGHLSDLFDRRLLIAIVNLALLATSGVVLWAADSGLVALAALGAVYGGLTFTLYPLAVAHINDRVQSDSFVGVAAALLFIWGLGAVIGPAAIGGFMSWFGPDGLLLCVAAAAALMALATVMLRREAVPDHEQTAFVGMSRTTSAITELDPRQTDPQLDWLAMLDSEPTGQAVAGDAGARP
jgi:MFS family permease